MSDYPPPAVITTTKRPALPAASAERNEEDRAQVRGQMSAALLKVADKIEEEIDEWEKSTIKSRWRIGELIQEVQDNPLLYGKNSYVLLAAYFNSDRMMLSQAKTCYETFAKNEINEFISARTKTGKALTWQHLTHLCAVKDRKVREALQTQSLNQDLTAGALKVIVGQYLEPANGAAPVRGKSTGRKVVVPANPDIAVSKLENGLLTAVNLIEAFADEATGLAARYAAAADRPKPARVKTYDNALKLSQELAVIAENFGHTLAGLKQQEEEKLGRNRAPLSMNADDEEDGKKPKARKKAMVAVDATDEEE